jgi:hypothetical protein
MFYVDPGTACVAENHLLVSVRTLFSLEIITLVSSANIMGTDEVFK